MTNLSDLLPAGAASKQLSFTADGAIASGQTVALQTAGTVKAVGTVAESIGSKSVFDTDTQDNKPVFDTSNNKVVVAYQDDGNSSYGTAVVGTVSGSGITFGTPVVFSTNTMDDVCIAFDSTNNKVMIFYRRGASSHGYCVVGTVSGTSISFGSEFEAVAANSQFLDIVFDSSVGRFLLLYRDAENSNYGTCRIVYISGTSVVAAGAEIVFRSALTTNISGAFDSDQVRVVITYISSGGRVRLAKNLGNAQPDFNTDTVFDSGAGSGSAKPENSTVYDSVNKKILISYRDNSNSSYGTTLVGTVSAADNAITFGTEVVFETAEVHSISSTVDTTNNRLVVFYYDVGNGNRGTYAVGTVSGTSISFGTPVVIEANTDVSDTGATFDSNAGKVVLTYRDASDSGKGTAQVLQNVSTNSSSFLGIADEAISNAASGKITMKGGVATNSQLLPLAYTGSLGSAAVYQSTATEYQGIAFDSSNNKVVVAYKNDSNAQGTAAVGTVSGTGITWGTPVVFATASTSYCDVVFDSSNNKIVIVYSDVANSEYGTAIVGTVSGTSISFGSEVVFASAATTYIRAAFDSNENKVVVAYRDDGNSQYGTAIVGNVSGTSISFGTEVVFDSTGALSAAFGGFVFDSTNNKIVIPYTRSVSHCIVGTVSGTSISFGTKVDFGGTISYQNLSVAFDSNAGKVVINGRDSNNSDYFGSLVGTVSGTSISFGTQLVIEEVHTVGATAFDSSDNQIIYAYKDNSTSSAYYRLGTVSGTSISYGSASALTSGNVAYMDSTFDSSQNTTVIIYKDVANSNYGTARGVQVSGAYPNLVPNTTYYVQDDGTISTTSSSVTAGKAMSTNSINLDYST